MLKVLSINLKAISGILALVILGLYYAMFSTQHISDLSKYMRHHEVSPLEMMLDRAMGYLQDDTEAFLDGLVADSIANCPRKSDFYEGSFYWFINEIRIGFNDWWRETAQRYTNDLVTNNASSLIEGAWLEDNGGLLDNRHAQFEAVLFYTEEAQKVRRANIPKAEGVDPSKITIISATDVNSGMKLEQAKQAIKQRQEYADYHGNKFKFYNLTKFHAQETVEHPVWLKLPLVEATFKDDPDCEWVWWLDTDIVLMNGNFDLSRDLLNPAAMEELYIKSARIPETLDRFGPGGRSPTTFNYEDINFVLSVDFNGINMGSVLIHRSEITEEVLQIWSDPLQVYNSGHEWRHVRREQDAFARLWQDLDVVKKSTAFVGSPILNSYIANCSCRFVAGDTVMHLAGRSGYESYTDEWNLMFANYIKPGDPIPEEVGVGTFPGVSI